MTIGGSKGPPIKIKIKLEEKRTLDQDYNEFRRKEGSPDQDYDEFRRKEGSSDQDYNEFRRKEGSTDQDYNEILRKEEIPCAGLQ